MAAAELLLDFLNAVVHARMIDAATMLQNNAVYALGTGQEDAVDQADTTILWYRLLLGEAIPDATVGDASRKFMHQWQQWLSQAIDLSQGKVRIVFSLREPTPPAGAERARPGTWNSAFVSWNIPTGYSRRKSCGTFWCKNRRGMRAGTVRIPAPVSWPDCGWPAGCARH